ncbi:MAG: hypothetical protein J7K68_03015 [Candidatus Diapherotrites archaeon]|nr:hypothetical protein [Candidatus Diapherotrites archaeon]
MRTYLTLWFSSDGTSPIEVEKKLREIGFVSMTGSHDLEYIWDKNPTVDDILALGNLIQKTLKGDKVLFKMETV